MNLSWSKSLESMVEWCLQYVTLRLNIEPKYDLSEITKMQKRATISEKVEKAWDPNVVFQMKKGKMDAFIKKI